MLGMVYTVFADMAEESLGLAGWNQLLATSGIESDGAFTAGDRYKDADLVKLIVAYAEKIDLPVEFVIREFGIFLFKQLALSHSAMIQNYATARELLLAVEDIIHREVKKLYPVSSLPTFRYEQSHSDDPNNLTMIYTSERKLCHLAEGLIVGAGEFYQTEISIIHSLCTHRGDDVCRLELSFHT